MRASQRLILATQRSLSILWHSVSDGAAHVLFSSCLWACVCAVAQKRVCLILSIVRMAFHEENISRHHGIVCPIASKAH